MSGPNWQGAGAGSLLLRLRSGRLEEGRCNAMKTSSEPARIFSATHLPSFLAAMLGPSARQRLQYLLPSLLSIQEWR
jgi:hypothetical protein